MNMQGLFKTVLASLSILVCLGLVAPAALAVPPTNDGFASATTINLNALPFAATVNTTEATTEFNEPQYCIFSYQTVWYRFTPAVGTWLEASGQHVNYYGSSVNVFRAFGSGISGLSYLGCSIYSSNGVVLFNAQAGATYYLQVQAPCCYVSGNMNVSLREVPAPQPVANFYYYPSDPSMFDVVQFVDQSSDPGQVGIQTRVWDFGDGTPSPMDSSGYYTTHQFAVDGQYTVRLDVTTFDGRSASTSQVVTVATHDVAITQFQTPQSASVGQTRQISVGIRNNRHPETVRVELFKSSPGSYQSFRSIGYSEQFVPVRPSNRTTDFDFNYTINREDGMIGKVTFKAVATILNGHDALYADNEAISLPTKVQGGGSANWNPVMETPAAESTIELALMAVSPNPARANADLSMRLSLATEDAALVQVFDISGRVMAKRDLGLLGAGIHEARVAWDRNPSPGVYWVRLTQSGRSVVKKIGVF